MGDFPNIQRFVTLKVLTGMKDGVHVMSSFRKVRQLPSEIGVSPPSPTLSTNQNRVD